MSTVELFRRTKNAGKLGLAGIEGARLDWAAVIDRKDGIIESWSKGKKQSLEKRNIAVLQGVARFTGPYELLVGDRRVTAERFVIATGSSPARPPIEGAERGITSDEFLSLRSLPSRLVVIGAGVIGIELGFCAAMAGSRVAILQRGPQILPGADGEMRDALLEIGRKAGMEFHTGAGPVRIAGDRTVEAVLEGRAEGFPADEVLIATGRPPNTSRLDLQKAGVELDRGGIKVNEFLQSTSAPQIYAAGDVIGQPQHTPVAWYEGPIAARNALKGNEQKVDLHLLPTAVFTIPALGQVGMTESEARSNGLEVAISRSPFSNNPAAGVREQTEGLVKVVYEKGTGRLLGVHVLGPHAEDLVQIAAAGMRGGLTREQFGAMHYVFPTLGGAIFDAMAG